VMRPVHRHRQQSCGSSRWLTVTIGYKRKEHPVSHRPVPFTAQDYDESSVLMTSRRTHSRPGHPVDRPETVTVGPVRCCCCCCRCHIGPCNVRAVPDEYRCQRGIPSPFSRKSPSHALHIRSQSASAVLVASQRRRVALQHHCSIKRVDPTVDRGPWSMNCAAVNVVGGKQLSIDRIIHSKQRNPREREAE